MVFWPGPVLSFSKSHTVTKSRFCDGFAMTQQCKAQSYNDLWGTQPNLSQNLSWRKHVSLPFKGELLFLLEIWLLLALIRVKSYLETKEHFTKAEENSNECLLQVKRSKQNMKSCISCTWKCCSGKPQKEAF